MERMKRMNQFFKKHIALLLAFAIVFSGLAPALADESKQDSQTFESAERIEQEVNDLRSQSGPTRIIVELEEEALIDLANRGGVKVSDLDESLKSRQEKAIDIQRNQVIESIENAGFEINLEENFDSVISGFSADVDGKDLGKIQEIEGVKSVSVSRKYEAPALPSMVGSLEELEIDLIWGGDLNYKGEGSVIAVLDTGFDPYHKDFNITDPTRVALTEGDVNALKATNPSLKGIYINEKVPYAYDYHDEDTIVKENKDSSHGMHVAGTIAANGDTANGGIKGVAPEAQILAMKVFSDAQNMPYVYNDIYVRAIDDAIILGADAINLSLGAYSGAYTGSDMRMEQVFQKCLDNGIVPVVANGNDSNFSGGGWSSTEMPDQGTAGTPAVMESAFSVASLENKVLYTSTLSHDGSSYLANLHETTADMTLPSDVEYFVAGWGAPENYKDLKAEGLDLQGKIAVVERGGDSYQTFTEKKNVAQDYGAIGLVIYNNESNGENLINMLIDSPIDIPVALLVRSGGLKLVNAFEAARTDGFTSLPKLSFDDEKSFVDNPLAGHMSDFTSWGPSTDLRIKPEITAYGGHIYSTQNDDSYSDMSGTSMATPHVAGAVALVKQHLRENNIVEPRTRESAELVIQLLMNTATPVVNPEEGYTYSVMVQGAGVINPEAAVTTPVRVKATGTNDNKKDPKLEIKSISDNEFTAVLEFTNDSDKDVVYTPSVMTLIEPAYVDGWYVPGHVTKEVDSSLNSQEPITIPAGQTKTVEYKVEFEEIANNQLVNGFITFDSETAVSLTVPFLGFLGDWGGPRVIEQVYPFRDGVWNNEQGRWEGNSWEYRSYFAYFDPNRQGNERAVELPSIRNDDNFMDSEVYFSRFTGIFPSLALLRNSDYIEFSIHEPNGDLVTVLDRRNNVTRSDVWWNTTTAWYGMINNLPVDHNSEWIYRITAKANYGDAQDQVYDFKIIADHEGPEISIKNFDATKRTLDILAIDDSHRVEERWIGLRNPDTGEEVRIDLWDRSVRPEGWNWRDPFPVEIPESWNPENLIVFAEDELFNISEKITDNLAFNKDLIGKVPKIAMTYPAYLEMVTEKEIELVGYVWNVDGIKDIVIDELDENGNVIRTIPMEEIELTFVGDAEVPETYSGPAWEFRALYSPNKPLNTIRITVTDKYGEVGGMAQRFFLDITPPSISLFTEEKCTSEATAEIEITVNDDLGYVRVYRVLGDENDEWFFQNFIGEINQYNQTNTPRPIVNGKLYDTVNLIDGENIFYYEVQDEAGNWWRESITITKSDICPVEPIEPETEEPSQPEDPGPVLPPENPGGKPSKPDPDKPIVVPVREPEKPELEEIKPEDTITEEKETIENIDLKDVIEGADRYLTSIEISKKTFDSSDHVILVSGENYPDALASGPLAALLDSPILLSRKDSIPNEVIAEIERLGAKKVYITAGPNSISDEILLTLEEIGLDVERLYGKDRYETAEKIAELVQSLAERDDYLVLASGKNYADALSIAPYAGKEKVGILLVKDELTDKATETIGKAEKVIIAGGLMSVSAEIENAIKEMGVEVERISGKDRYGTSEAIREKFFPEAKKAVLASGETYPDALTGAVYAIKENAPILLLRKDSIPEVIEKGLEKSNIEEVTILGGNNTISEKVKDLFK